ncbi:MAG TPA: hypothetical protein VMX13_03875 [Sedimentisphaerales bacterium]|nr:hypothetical protein [Sedimentisphaerales bacterium]
MPVWLKQEPVRITDVAMKHQDNITRRKFLITAAGSAAACAPAEGVKIVAVCDGTPCDSR